MFNQRKLIEGLHQGDLQDMLLPMISVDEYESKIDDKAIVVAFFVHDVDAANDLNRFIQTSSIDILDSEVSPAPDKHGYYFVFVEFMTDKNLVKNINKLLLDVEPLVNITEWQMRVRKTKDLVNYSEEALTNCLHKAIRTDEHRILQFLQNSALMDAKFDEDHLILQDSRQQKDFSVLSFGAVDDVLSESGMNDKPLVYNLRNVSRSKSIAAMLGEHWLVEEIDGVYIVSRDGSSESLLLREI